MFVSIFLCRQAAFVLQNGKKSAVKVYIFENGKVIVIVVVILFGYGFVNVALLENTISSPTTKVSFSAVQVGCVFTSANIMLRHQINSFLWQNILFAARNWEREAERTTKLWHYCAKAVYSYGFVCVCLNIAKF